jgi:hypothetical protein
LLVAIWNFSPNRKRFLFDQSGRLRPAAGLNLLTMNPESKLEPIGSGSESRGRHRLTAIVQVSVRK